MVKSLRQGNIIVAKELAKRYGDQGIVSISLNPGMILHMKLISTMMTFYSVGNLKTDLQRHTTALQHWIIVRTEPLSAGHYRFYLLTRRFFADRIG